MVAAVRVLFVEDESLIRLVTSQALQDEGFEVVEAWNGDEAARLLDSSDGFDVLFTDVQMPGTLDGLDVAMHARRRFPGIPVLVVSGYAPHLIRRLDALEPSVVFIGKPYSLDELLVAIRRLTTTLWLVPPP